MYIEKYFVNVSGFNKKSYTWIYKSTYLCVITRARNLMT